MYVTAGASEKLIEDERRRFLEVDLPDFKDRAERLGFSVDELLKEVL